MRKCLRQYGLYPISSSGGSDSRAPSGGGKRGS
jgi:hypothetical protein